MSYSTAYSMEIGATHREESFCICRSGDMRPNFRPRGVRLGCIANDVRAFRFENRDSYLRICRVALRGYVVGQLRHQIKNRFWSKNWAFFARKSIVGIPRFGGAGETIYNRELKYLRKTSPAVAEDYETLNSLSNDMSDFAKEVVLLVERLVTPRNVFVIMSFKTEFEDVWTSCDEVCGEFKFQADRTDKSTSLERVVARIETGIQKSAFVIADASKLSVMFLRVGVRKGSRQEGNTH